MVYAATTFKYTFDYHENDIYWYVFLESIMSVLRSLTLVSLLQTPENTASFWWRYFVTDTKSFHIHDQPYSWSEVAVCHTIQGALLQNYSCQWFHICFTSIHTFGGCTVVLCKYSHEARPWKILLSRSCSPWVCQINACNNQCRCTADCGWITGHSYLTYGPLLNGASVVVFEGVRGV